MPCPSKLMPEIQQKKGQNLSLGFTYSIAANSVGIIYQMFNEWMKMGQTEKSGRYYQFYQYVQKCNVDGVRRFLERFNDAAEAGN